MYNTYEQQLNKLRAYINSCRPIIYINHFDFKYIDEIIKKVNDKAVIFEYSNADGWIDFETKGKKQKWSLADFLYSFDNIEDKNCFILLKDINHELKNPIIISRLKSIAEKTMYINNIQLTIFIISSQFYLSPELEKLITIFDIPLPNHEEIKIIINNYTKELNLNINEELSTKLMYLFKGLSEFEIRQIIRLANSLSDKYDNSILIALKEKEEIIKKTGILEIINDDSNIYDIGGLEGLKDYLIKKERIINNIIDAIDFGIEPPKGILIVGYPGCGKSLSAKATAKLLGVPLLRLDIGKIMGKYVGESEDNLRKAIKTAEAISPCVLWIDELEKAFAGVNSEGGASDITTRLFGQFLTWLQEKRNGVYVVATANNIKKLPPEFLRKGRFDELFKVKLPDEAERKAIFEAILKKKKKLSSEIDFDKLINKSDMIDENGLKETCKGTDGFSGADIEAVVNEAIELAFISDDKQITTLLLQKCINNTISLSETMKKDIEELENEYKKYVFKDANKVFEDNNKASYAKRRDSEYNIVENNFTPYMNFLADILSRNVRKKKQIGNEDGNLFQ